MRLVELAIENFRGYGARTVLPIDSLTVLIGKNDAGKSTLLDALHLVLGEGKPDVSDIHVHAPDQSELLIECAFEDLPTSLTLDAGSVTSLADEYLVDDAGRLRLRWGYGISGDRAERKLGKLRTRLVAHHPTHSQVSDLHSTKNADLKKLVEAHDISAPYDRTNNASMRKALWSWADASGGLGLATVELDLSKEDGKGILAQLQAALPMYVLFRADRPSTDQDVEVQDPMKVAIRTALEELRSEVEAMKARVKRKAMEVADRTLSSLREFDHALASSLTPEFADPKLDSAFKLALLGDDGIAVNKRGSGVRRLVLFSFFRAEADRRQSQSGGRGIIYAIEEPETAQHPDFQRKVVSSLRRLAEADGCQVLLTTHSPGLAGLMPSTSLRLVYVDGTYRKVTTGETAMSGAIETLGVVPDHRVRVLVCVEGPHDRALLQAACEAYRTEGEDLVCLSSDPSVAFVLLGGSTLSEWVSRNLLGHLKIPEFHLYDGDVTKYGASVAEVNGRDGKHSARQTQKRELENYLHPDAISRVLSGPAGTSVCVTFGNWDDVEAAVSKAIPDPQGNPRKKLERRAIKHWLNHDVAANMTAAEFRERDPDGELESWLKAITVIARGAT
jgi:putative ATP-dependent endonuclease of OLD family